VDDPRHPARRGRAAVRVAAHLAGLGVGALGIDVVPAAVWMARARGAEAVQRSVFGHGQGAGTWGTAVLLDGNLGIGGDPVALLARVRELLTPGGRVLCDVEPPGTPARTTLVGLALSELWSAEGRWFARLDGAAPRRR
jgi:hypothetical protein